MSVNYTTAAKTQRLQVVADTLKGLTYAASTGTATAPSLVIGTSAFVNAAGTASITTSTTGVLAIVSLPTAGITVSGTQLSLVSSTQSATAANTGTAAKAAIINNAGTITVGGLTADVSANTPDVTLASTAISSGQTVSVTSAAINHP